MEDGIGAVILMLSGLPLLRSLGAPLESHHSLILEIKHWTMKFATNETTETVSNI